MDSANEAIAVIFICLVILIGVLTEPLEGD